MKIYCQLHSLLYFDKNKIKNSYKMIITLESSTKNFAVPKISTPGASCSFSPPP